MVRLLNMDSKINLKINPNSIYFLLTSYLLALVSIFQVAKATIFEKNNFEFIDINPWAFTELLINYEGGFVRRGFVGNLIFQIDSDGILFDTLYDIVFINFFVFVILILINLDKSNLTSLQKLLFHISIFAPFNITLFSNFVARKEIFIINFYLLILLIFKTSNKKIFLFSCFFFSVLSILIHEGITFFIYFPFLVYLMKKKNVQKKFITGFIYMIVFIFTIIILNKGNSQIVNQIWSSLSSQDIVLINNLNPNAITAIGWGVIDTLKTTYVLVFSGSLIYWSVFFVMLIYTISIVFNDLITETYLNLKTILVSNKQFLLILPLFIIGFDWGRWILTIFYLLFFTLLLEYKKNLNSLRLTYNLIFFTVISLLTELTPCCIAMEGTAVSSNYYRIFKSIELTITQFLN